MRISDRTVEDVRQAADIIEVVSGFVRLKKAGRNHIGLCPFHQEKTPSFMVNADKGIFKCFGCGKGGDVFSFLMETEQISFLEAVQELAERCHISIVADEAPVKETKENIDELHEASRFAARFFYDTLMGDAGGAAREYFERREWSEDTMRRFGLGYSPDDWSGLRDIARKNSISDDVLERCGLIIKRDDGHIYDRFRGRAMFPIFSVGKKVIGFGARAMKVGEEPKYLNSPETSIYNKSKVLYGLSHAVRDIRTKDEIIIVEGYADLLTMSQAGFTNVVATSGTALTPDQVRLIRRYTRNLYFLYDADSAGFNAMMRGLDVILEQDCDARLVTLTTGEDPDSFIRKKGADALRERLVAAVSFVDFITARYQQQGALDSPDGKTQAVRHIVGLLAKMDDPIRRELYIHHISEKYRIYENLLFQELNAILKQKKRQPAQRAELRAVDRDEAAEPIIPKEIPNAEKTFLATLLKAAPEIQNEALRAIHVEAFRHPIIRDLLHLVLDEHELTGAVRIGAIWNEVASDPVVSGILAGMLMEDEVVSIHWKKIQTVLEVDQRRALLDGYKKILVSHIDEKRKEISLLLQRYANDPDESLAAAKVLRALFEKQNAVKHAHSFADLPDIEHDAEVTFDAED